MTNAQAIAVILRVAGLWLLIRSLLVAMISIPISLSSDGLIAATAVFISFLLLGAWLALRPLVVARILLPGTSSETTTANWSVDEFQAAMFSVLGMYFLVTTVTDLAGWVQVWYHLQESIRLGAVTDFYGFSQIGSFVLRLVAGVWLLLGAKGLRGILRKLRS